MRDVTLTNLFAKSIGARIRVVVQFWRGERPREPKNKSHAARWESRPAKSDRAQMDTAMERRIHAAAGLRG